MQGKRHDMRLTKAVINTWIKINSFEYKFIHKQIMNKQDEIIQTAWKRIRFIQLNK